ncbi:MAG: tRNA 2-thiouridine(34) synthase MnmA [Candidatus Paceibacterota bacterium]
MKKQVFVGMSGGVDSSVAALRLKQQGYDVTGVFIKVWHPEWLVCNWEAERLDAMRVAAHLEIPFLTCNAQEAYKKGVADYFIAEYEAGRTPNPDVMCNQHVKFGAFLEFAKKHGADYIATGHYAQNHCIDGTYTLKRGNDTDKDQSYFLWTLTQEQLQHILFPVGDTPKSTIRKEAETAKLPTAKKQDSQGICFLGHIDIPEFLSHYVKLIPGEVRNKSGEVIGEHTGALVYTLGQRHGFTLHTKTNQEIPHYVVSKDIKANTITVDTTPGQKQADSKIILQQINIITDVPTDEQLEVQFRYRQKPLPSHITDVQANSLTIEPQITYHTPAPGQSCVLYQGDVCLGGGIITA